jgi:hypothetical protein
MPRTETDQPAIQADLIAEYIHAHHPSWSIDTLLAHPTDALAFGLCVTESLQKINPKEAAKIRRIIRELNDAHGPAVSAIQSVCLAAINLRKRGHFNRRDEV